MPAAKCCGLFFSRKSGIKQSLLCNLVNLSGHIARVCFIRHDEKVFDKDTRKDETAMTLTVLNSVWMYLLCGSVILFVIALSILFLVRAWKAGLAMGLDKANLKKVVVSSCTFTLLPSISILLGVIALAGTLGVPLPWMRLSVVGALHYETSVADIAARSLGLSGLNASEMTLQVFTTIALLMGAGIIWGMVCTVLFNKGYLKRISRKSKEQKPGAKSFGDTAMTAMFIGLVACYVGSYVGIYTSSSNIIPLAVLLCSAAAMAGFTWLIEKKGMKWLESFSLAASMLVGMAAAVGLGLIV